MYAINIPNRFPVSAPEAYGVSGQPPTPFRPRLATDCSLLTAHYSLLTVNC